MSRSAWRAVVFAVLAAFPVVPNVARAAGDEPPADGTRPKRPIVLVSSTMLGAAAADLCGERLQIRTLVPAQGCPGHFDLTPRAMVEASEARLVLVHDYQTVLGERLRGGDPHRDVVAVPTTGTQTLPEHYLALCRQTAAALIERLPGEADSIVFRLRRLEVTIPEVAARELVRARARVGDRPLVVARMQADFAVWAGAKPAVLFDAMEDTSLRELDAIVSDGRRRRVSGLIGNRQWGDREARAVAGELRIPWTLLGNYPEESAPGAWVRLLRANVDRLAELAGDE